MPYDPQIHHRRSIRLKGYDYTRPGAYFVTVCTQNRAQLFGDVINGKMVLNAPGIMIQKTWQSMPDRFPGIRTDAYVIMPNHFHAIVTLVGATLVVAPNAVAPDVVAPDVVAPNVVAPDVVAPNAVAPDVVAPNVVDPDVVAPNVIAPDVVAPNAVAPDVVAPNVIDHDMALSGGDGTERAGTSPAPTGLSRKTGLGDVVGVFKSITTREYIVGVREMGWPPFDKRLWQRNYWEHIIRTPDAYAKIEDYIIANPTCWQDDRLHPNAPPDSFNQNQ